ncbi:S41 family peptidase [Pseudoflavonifractor phocaeensis]|uniref:S41 family peptidase n=1 Tax=Pseudoflavonifractor phocaeensis TaxID=1870988 RepID=UPI00195E859C|nr:S41 family peptidase [Pseudoflavonifractor phocaeensis]MBM6869072.1 S-layer homology domain-containing protein [Pseudoflavonifractor phocaeensis]
MSHTFRRRFAALVLALSLLTLPARALTAQEAGQLLQDYYIDDVSQEVLAQPTIDAMLSALGDRYTTYFTADEYAAFLASMEDVQLTGIGVKMQASENGPVVVEVLAGSPALEAGLQAGDLITAVDGVSTAGLEMGAVSALIQGQEGTQVTITYLRDGVSAACTLTRSSILVAATSAQLLEDHVGLLTCTTFGHDTYAHFTEALDQFPQADRWIVDLRDNGGGLTQAALDTLSVFTGGGIKCYFMDGSAQLSALEAKREQISSAPLIVLTDGGTASASEIFSAGIRDLKAGLVIGGRTYGKGVAQSVLDQYTNPELFDGDAMKITTVRFYTASGSTTDTVGVIPHLLVSPDLAQEVALLLSAAPPSGGTAGYYRLDLNGSWYISQKAALAQPEVFAQLLAAIPPTAALWQGSGDGWNSVQPQQAAADHSIPFQSRLFSDVEGSPYAQSIQRLAVYGVVLGNGQGSYFPKSSLTRAQLAALLAQALNCTVPTDESLFSDVSMDDSYGLAINAIAKMGLVEGVGNGLFRPDDTVTHEQFFTIMGRLAQRVSLTFQISRQGATQEDLDSDRLSRFAPWSRLSVWLLSSSQLDELDQPVSLLWDDVTRIDPTAPISREEAADLLCAVLERTGILPA